MAMIACWECGKEISESAQACPHCGAPKKEASTQVEQAVAPAPVETPAPQKSGLGFFSWFFIIVFGLFAIFMAIGAASSNSSSDKRSRINEECDKMMADAAPGDEKRRTRAICDQMKANAR